jgi:hypothetical protein
MRPLGHREKLEFECPWLSDPSHEPAEGKTCFLLHLPMISLFEVDNFLFHTAMPQEEIDRFVARLFDKDPLTMRPDTLSLPYSSENSPPSVRITIFLLTFYSTTNIFFWLVIQDLYPDWEIDVALSNQDNIGSNEPTGDDAGGNGAPSVETLTPNPIGSSLAGETHPSAANRAASTASSGGGQKKKCVVLGTKCKQDKVVVDHVIIELPPYRGPRSPLE